MRIVALLLLASALFAQDLTPKAAPQKRTIVIVNATIHPVSGPTIERGFIVFDKGRIVRVGPGTTEVQEGWRAIDGEGKQVYPGLISPYSRLGLTEIGAVRATHDFTEVGALKPEVRAAMAVNPDSTLLPVTRTNGVLLFATFPSGGLIPGRASVMRMDGWTWEDMALRADAGLVVSWPARRPNRPRRRPRPQQKPPQPAETRRQKIEEAFARARAYLAARAADAKTPTDVRWEAMRPALEGKRPVFFLADGYDQIVGAVEYASSIKVRAVIVGGRDAHLCADLLTRRDVAVIVNGVHRFPKRSDSDYDAVYRLPRKLEAAGVRWCLASGERVANERNLPYTAARAVAYGLDRKAALASITLGAAQILGIDKETGSLERGKAATLIVTDGDPLDVTTHVEQAFIDGRQIELGNKQTKLAAKYKTKYRQLGDIR